MTAYELKYKTLETAPYFFTSKTMKCFGDTMKNFGVCSAVVDTYSEKGVEVWELYRRKPSRRGLTNSHYFRKDNFEAVFAKKGE